MDLDLHPPGWEPHPPHLPLLIDVEPDLPGKWTFFADQANAQSQSTPGGSTTLTHAPIGPVLCTAFSCEWKLSDFGSGEATIPIRAEGSALTREHFFRFFGWRLWAFYDGQPVWMGLPTALTDEGGPAVTVAFTEGIGYLARKQHALRRTYTQAEQVYIGDQLAARLDNVGIRRVLQPGPGFPRDRSYDYLEGTSRAELLQNLSQVLQGPEFRSEYAIDSLGRLDPSLRIAYPRVGSDTGLGVKVPGGAVEFSMTWDSEQFRTRTFAVGELPEDAPEDARRPVVMIEANQWAGGIPNIDAVDDWPGVVLTSTLNERAQTNAAIYATPTLELTCTQPVDAPPLGSYGVGDDVTVMIADPLFPDGYSTTGRLSGLTADAAAGTVGWTVTITQPPARPSTGLITQLAQAASWRANVFHTRLEDPPPGIEE